MLNKIKNGLSKAADSIGDVARTVADKASDAYDATTSGLSNAGSIVAEVAIGAKDVIGDAASSAYESTQAYASAVASGEKDVKWGNVLLGASIGVAAVAAAPFTGGGSLLGGATLATSLAGAGVAAGAAAVTGGAIANKFGDDSKTRDEAYRQGVMETKAQHQFELEHLQKSLAFALNGLKGAAEHYNAIIAMHAVAVATANCDGVICDSERANIELFIAGVATSSIPAEVTAKLQSLYDNPPSIREAFELAKNSGVAIPVFDEVIQVVIHADGVQHPQEDAFMQAWNTLNIA